MKDNFMNKNNRETFKVEWNDPKNAGLDLDQGIDYDERLAPHFIDHGVERLPVIGAELMGEG
jgi:hypothetical protein